MSATNIISRNNIYCIGWMSCHSSNIFEAEYLFCSGWKSCYGVTIQSAGGNTNIFLLGEESGQNMKIYCNESDNCWIICGGYNSCKTTEFYCNGNCTVKYKLPIGYQLPTANPTIDPTKEPTQSPITTYPTIDPTKEPTQSPLTVNPTMNPTKDPTQSTITTYPTIDFSMFYSLYIFCILLIFYPCTPYTNIIFYRYIIITIINIRKGNFNRN